MLNGLMLWIFFVVFFVFFFNDTATTEIYTLSLHDALPISGRSPLNTDWTAHWPTPCRRSEEHTSELQSRQYLVCRLLLEKKKKKQKTQKNKKKKKKKQKKTKKNQNT